MSQIRRRESCRARSRADGVVTPQILCGFIVFLVLAGCGDSPEPAPPPRDDPAMAPMPQPDLDLSQTQTTVDDPFPEHPTRRDGRVFFPQTGWVDESEFWASYENDPEQIPPDLDLHAAHELRAAYHRELASTGEANHSEFSTGDL